MKVKAEQNLIRLLRDNQDTDFGRAHGFREIEDADEYRRNVPLSTYDDYEEGIRRMRRGEKHVLTAYELAAYCKTSGTEGRTKYIPVTYESLSRYSDWSERYKNRVYRAAGGGKRLFVNTFRTMPNDGKIEDRLFSELYNRWMCENGLLRLEEYAGGEEGLFDREAGEALYAKVWLGFATEDLVLLEAAFQYDVLNFFAYMERRWEEILRDMERGEIPVGVALSERMRRRLLACRPGEERLAEVRRECGAGFEQIAGRLWKGLRAVCGISSRAYSAEDAALRRYTGSIPRQYLCYCASECFMGVPVDENSFAYRLVPENAFYEFLPYDEAGENDGETLLMHQLKRGELYEIVVTNYSGLYRYRMGDILKVVDFDDGVPVVEFMFRRNQAFSLAGEKLDVRHLETAIESLRAEFPVELFCFGVTVRKMPGVYYALVTLGEDGGGAGLAERLSAALDDALGEANVDYQDLRQLGQLGRAEVFPVSGEKLSELLARYLPAHRHNKPVHVLPMEISEKLYGEVEGL